MKTDVITRDVVADRLTRMAKALILLINDDPSLADMAADYHLSRTGGRRRAPWQDKRCPCGQPAEWPTHIPGRFFCQEHWEKPEHWMTCLCDGCGKPFTREEYGDRETPHEPTCPNFDADTDEDGMMEHVACTCDRNFHPACYDWTEQAVTL